MSDYATRQSHRNSLAQTVDEERIALDIVQRQYIAGATDFLSVLTVQKDLLTTQQALAASSTDVCVSLVDLFRALGGGWETRFPVISSQPAQVNHAQRSAATHGVSTSTAHDDGSAR